MNMIQKCLTALWLFTAAAAITTACLPTNTPINNGQQPTENQGDVDVTLIPSNTPADEAAPVDERAAVQALLADYDCLPAQTGGEWAEVIQVIDGDTITVELDGAVHKVRYIGVNTPEMDEPTGMDSKEFNREMVSGQNVFLLKDVSETDQYGRLLRYVFTAEYFVNYELLRSGYAMQLTYPPDVACTEIFQEAAEAARNDAVGLWEAPEEENEQLQSIQISEIFYNGVQGENEADEYVVIENTGAEAVDLHNWYLKDQGTHRFVFPSFQIAAGQVCRVYTNEDHPEYCSFSFEQSESAVWNNSGDCAYLFTPDGTLVDEFCY